MNPMQYPLRDFIQLANFCLLLIRCVDRLFVMADYESPGRFMINPQLIGHFSSLVIISGE